MKRTLLFIFAFVALAGILNCAVIEPAFACKDEVVHSEQSGDSNCCFIHCSMHHQWVASSTIQLKHNIAVADFIPASFDFHHDSPAGSIFHPPLAI